MTPALSRELDQYIAEREALTSRLAEVNAHIATLEERAVRVAENLKLANTSRWPVE